MLRLSGMAKRPPLDKLVQPVCKEPLKVLSQVALTPGVKVKVVPKQTVKKAAHKVSPNRHVLG